MEIFSSYTGPDFLVFYAVMLATCVFLGLWIPANLRPMGRRNPIEDMEEAAVLAGGIGRHSLAVCTDLMARDGLTAGAKKKLRVNRQAVDSGTAGKALLRKVGDFDYGELKKATASVGKSIEARLIRRGLLMDEGEGWRLRLLSVVPYVALLVLGLYRQQAGSALGEPTGFLVGLMALTFVFAVMRIAKFNTRTMAGNLALRDLEAEASRMKRAPQPHEAGFAVALFGTGVLVGTPWEPVHAMRQSGGGDGAFSGDSDGGDGGGGCGGGCGGCGG